MPLFFNNTFVRLLAPQFQRKLSETGSTLMSVCSQTNDMSYVNSKAPWRPSMEMGAPTSQTVTPQPPNLSVSCTNVGLFLVPHSLQIKIRLLSGRRERRDSSEKRILRHSFLLQFTCSVAHSLRAPRYLAVNIGHIIGLRAYRHKRGAGFGQFVLKLWCQ